MLRAHHSTSRQAWMLTARVEWSCRPRCDRFTTSWVVAPAGRGGLSVTRVRTARSGHASRCGSRRLRVAAGLWATRRHLRASAVRNENARTAARLVRPSSAARDRPAKDRRSARAAAGGRVEHVG